jgi:hypothetical protein
MKWRNGGNRNGNGGIDYSARAENGMATRRMAAAARVNQSKRAAARGGIKRSLAWRVSRGAARRGAARRRGVKRAGALGAISRCITLLRALSRWRALAPRARWQRGAMAAISKIMAACRIMAKKK